MVTKWSTKRCWFGQVPRRRVLVLVSSDGSGISCARTVSWTSWAILLMMGVAIFMFACSASVAWASFEKVGEFGGIGEGALGSSVTSVAVNSGCYFHEKETGHPLSNSECAAFDPVNGDVYVAAGEDERVTRYDSKGVFLEAWGWGVADGAQEFQTCGPEEHRACQVIEGHEGEGAGEFVLPQGISVDQVTGDVYVLDTGRKGGVVQVFSGDGKVLVSSFGARGSSGPEELRFPHKDGVAVDSVSGRVFVVDHSGSAEARVVVFRREGAGMSLKGNLGLVLIRIGWVWMGWVMCLWMMGKIVW